MAFIFPFAKSSVRKPEAGQEVLNSGSATFEPRRATWPTRSSWKSRISAVQDVTNQPSGKAAILGSVSVSANAMKASLEASVARARVNMRRVPASKKAAVVGGGGAAV